MQNKDRFRSHIPAKRRSKVLVTLHAPQAQTQYRIMKSNTEIKHTHYKITDRQSTKNKLIKNSTRPPYLFSSASYTTYLVSHREAKSKLKSKRKRSKSKKKEEEEQGKENEIEN